MTNRMMKQINNFNYFGYNISYKEEKDQLQKL